MPRPPRPTSSPVSLANKRAAPISEKKKKISRQQHRQWRRGGGILRSHGWNSRDRRATDDTWGDLSASSSPSSPSTAAPGDDLDRRPWVQDQQAPSNRRRVRPPTASSCSSAGLDTIADRARLRALSLRHHPGDQAAVVADPGIIPATIRDPCWSTPSPSRPAGTSRTSVGGSPSPRARWSGFPIRAATREPRALASGSGGQDRPHAQRPRRLPRRPAPHRLGPPGPASS